MRKGILCGQAAWSAAAWLTVAWIGAGCYSLPEPRKTPDLSEKAVFAAAKDVIESRYAYTAAEQGQGFVVATTPISLDGSSKTRRQISVFAQRNYTGSYEPVVRVRKDIEVGEPILNSDPETDDLGKAVPLAKNEWKALCYLPTEEHELTHAILSKLLPKGM